MAVKDYKNILVIRTDRLGDLVLTTPVLRELKARFPQARVTLLARPATSDLVVGHPAVDEVLLDVGCVRGINILSFFKILRAVRRRKFDLVLNFHTKKRTNALCFLAGIPRRVGYRDEKWGCLLTDQLTDDRAQGKKHEAQYCLDVLDVLDGVASRADGAIENGKAPTDACLIPYISCQPEWARWAEQLWAELDFPDDGLVFAVHPGASCPSKRWPVLRFIELIQQLKMQYPVRIVLVGAADSCDFARQIKQAVCFPVVDLTGQTSVGQLIGLLKRCTLLISNDSGPVHIADAVGTPAVSIFTRNQPGINPERWRPLGPKSCYVAPPVNLTPNFAKGAVADERYFEQVTVKSVLGAVDAVYKLCYNQPNFSTTELLPNLSE